MGEPARKIVGDPGLTVIKTSMPASDVAEPKNDNAALVGTPIVLDVESVLTDVLLKVIGVFFFLIVMRNAGSVEIVDRTIKK